MRQRGFVAVEFVAGVAFLLVPVLLVVATLPQWVERRHAATVAAREAARVAAAAWPGTDPAAATSAARAAVANQGVDARDVRVRLQVDPERGGQIVATVTIRMPALAIPLIGSASAFSYSSTSAVRIDDYRSR